MTDWTIVDRVEQAIAFGRTPEWIIEHLEVDYPFIVSVRKRMDEAAVSEDVERQIHESMVRHPAGKRIGR